MPLLEGTLVAALFLIPGFVSLALALSPRSRAIRQSSLGTRIFGLLFFSVADWFLALLAYAKLPLGGSHCGDLATLLVGTDETKRVPILTSMLGLPSVLLWAGALMAVVTVATGGLCAILHHAALTGFAIRNFGLKSDGLGFLHRSWFRLSKGVESVLRWCSITDLFQPLGASYWLVLLKAASVLQRSSPIPRSRKKKGVKVENAQGSGDEGRVARVYVDVIQGDEAGGEGKVGVLYTGTVKHLVCETDGNVVFLLLTEAKRWSHGPSSPIHISSDAQLGQTPSAKPPGRWKPLENSLALGLDGRNIRNISFRLIERSQLTISAWPKPAG